MNAAITPCPLAQVVGELEVLLISEMDALKRLDHPAIEQLTDRKIELLRRLGSVQRTGATEETLVLVAQVRQRALTNQLLMVHARDLVRGMLDVLAPEAYQGKRPGLPRLLEVKG